jgi:hypothetical protein
MIRKKNIALYPAIAAICFACNAQPKLAAESKLQPAATYQWVKLSDSALFPKSYNFQLFSIRDTLWAFHPRGNYFSTDGKQWTKSALANSINNLAFLDYVYFNDAMYGLGNFDGNIERFRFRPYIYKSSDLKRWQTISTQSNIPERFFYHPYVFKNKLWIAGGMTQHESFADLWNSADAVHWDKVADNLPFGKRENSLVVTFKEKLYLLNNDVWSSADGLLWTQETKEILPGIAVFGYAAVVYDDQIWLLGCNRNGNFSSKVLASNDGKTWKEMDAPWSPRGGVAACVYKGKIFITGGKYGGMDINHPEFEYSNDVWSMEKIASEATAGKTSIGK